MSQPMNYTHNHWQPLYADISTEPSPAARCLMLIERHAPKFMRYGGGGTTRECANNRRKITDWERDEIRKRLLETNGNHQAEIGAEVGGVSQTTVSKIWRSMCQ